MITDGKIFRQLAIVRFLTQGKYRSFNEISSYILQISGEKISKKTFQRDQKEIEENFKCVIDYNYKENGHKIDSIPRLHSVFFQTASQLELLKLTATYQQSEPKIYFEPTTSDNSQYFMIFNDAVANRKEMTLDYFHTIEEKTVSYTIRPLALKDFKRRWYILAWNVQSSEIMHFDISRISNFDFSGKRFEDKPEYSIENRYKHSYGIVPPPIDSKPETIILRVKKPKLYYVEKLPFHSSQTLIKRGADYIEISITVHPTYDLYIELLSHGDEITVLSPNSVKQVMVNYLNRTLANYK
jgi:predicted DNA-binding transcriptional regulator YafY